MASSKNITNKKFNRLTAINFVEKKKQFHHWLFKCDCGNEKILDKNSVVCGNTKSCGCLRNEKVSSINKTHGLTNTRFYNIWIGMKTRCNNKNILYSKYWFEKGIKVEWDSFQEFRNDMHDSYLEHCIEFGIKNTSIDRIDGNNNYCKGNCRWATSKEQAVNRITRNKYSNLIIK